MEQIERKTADKKEYNKTGKCIIIAGAIFCYGTVMALMGYYMDHSSEVGQWSQVTSTPEVILSSREEIDALKFIPSDSLLMQQLLDDIDQDRKEEIFLFYLVNPRDFVYPSKYGELNIMILKPDAEGKYKIAWQYLYGSMSYLPDYTEDRIYIYEKETGMPKIKFFIDNSATNGLNFFVYYDKADSDFKILTATNEDEVDGRTSIKGPIEMKDTDGDGLQEISEIESGFIYKFDKKKRVYNVINSCMATKTMPKIGDSKNRIYRDDRYDYEIEFPIKSRIVCHDSTVRLGGIRIAAPINDIDISKIEEYKCNAGKETVIDSTPSGTHSIVCKKFNTDNGLDVFKQTKYWPHDGSFETIYSVIKKENSKEFTVVQITTASQGTGEGDFNNAVETFKFIK